MRKQLVRGVMAAAVVLAFGVPALAQSVVRGRVVDAKNQPVADAVVLFEAEGANRKMQTKTDKNGEFLQVGLQSGPYKVTASKDGVGSHTLPATVRQGPNTPMSFTIVPGGGGSAAASNVSPEERKKQLAIQAAAAEGVAAFNAGNNDLALAKFNEVIAAQPTCLECHLTLGQIYGRTQKYAEAEAAYKKAIELKPDSSEAYTGLTTLYNAQKKFDLAADASAKAAQFSGGAGGGGSAEALFNQGVVLFNAQKFPEAKKQFEAAVAADPNLAMAQYQLGMTALNLGEIPTAVAALEAYLKVDPNGPKAAEVKAALPALQGMLKK